jgi:hypothetical protein
VISAAPPAAAAFRLGKISRYRKYSVLLFDIDPPARSFRSRRHLASQIRLRERWWSALRCSTRRRTRPVGHDLVPTATGELAATSPSCLDEEHALLNVQDDAVRQNSGDDFERVSSASAALQIANRDRIRTRWRLQ